VYQKYNSLIIMRKHVLAGGPCCGKTWVAEELRHRGYTVLGEAAREIIRLRKPYDGNPGEGIIRQYLILARQCEKEMGIANKEGDVFLDRGVYDTNAYTERILGREVDAFMPPDLRRYSKVFFLERYPFEEDGQRVESHESDAVDLHERILEQYKRQGYNPIIVPRMELSQRVDFILDKIRTN
jgi:predicted ATPase